MDCPLMTWANQSVSLPAGQDYQEVLKGTREVIVEDVVVMTQACDLEHDKVSEIVLCPHYSLESIKTDWTDARTARGEKTNAESWRKYCDNIRNGLVWNMSMLNDGIIEDLSIGLRVVDFYTIYTVPRRFLESWLEQRGIARLRLLPPYREHLSQAFARYFMRVGLPVPVSRTY